MSLLLELLDTTSLHSADIKHSKSKINHIAQILFNQDAGPVKDLKRSKEAKFFGVANAKSTILDSKGDGIRLTFDNSTDSGEFEINSLSPLKIVKGSEEDSAIKSLYKALKIESKKKTNYVVIGDQTLMREVHLGKVITSDTIKFVKGLLKIVKKADPEEEAESEKKPEPKKEAPKEEPKKVEKKPEIKPEPKKEETKLKEAIILLPIDVQKFLTDVSKASMLDSITQLEYFINTAKKLQKRYM